MSPHSRKNSSPDSDLSEMLGRLTTGTRSGKVSKHSDQPKKLTNVDKQLAGLMSDQLRINALEVTLRFDEMENPITYVPRGQRERKKK